MLLVTLRPGADREALLRDLDVAKVRWSSFESIVSVLMIDMDELARFPLRDHPAVFSVTADGDVPLELSLVRSIELPDPLTDTSRWHLARHISRDNPWKIPGLRLPRQFPVAHERTGKGVDLYCLDTGLRETHAEFVGRTIGKLFTTDTSTGYVDKNGHGSAMLSQSAGKTCGYAVDANIFLCKVWSDISNGYATDNNILRGIDAALTNHKSSVNPGVIQLSFGSNVSSSTTNPYVAALEDCAANGLLTCCSMGNQGLPITGTRRHIPAVTPGVIAVGALDQIDGPAVFSNYSLETDILVGGVDILGADISGDAAYSASSGTSSAAAIMGGVVACLLEGYEKPTTKTQVHQFMRYVYDQATFGRYQPRPDREPNTPAIAYLDPRAVDQCVPIPGLVRSSA